MRLTCTGRIALLFALVIVIAACATSSVSSTTSTTLASTTTDASTGTTAPTASSAPSGAIGSLASYNQRAETVMWAFYHCMVDRGWALALSGDSPAEGWDIAVPEEQLDVYTSDDAECQAESGLADLGPPMVSSVEAAELYDLLLDVTDCVRGLGLEVEEPPSRQTFVEALVTHPIPIWHPHELNGVWRPDLEEECPVPDWP